MFGYERKVKTENGKPSPNPIDPWRLNTCSREPRRSSRGCMSRFEELLANFSDFGRQSSASAPVAGHTTRWFDS